MRCKFCFATFQDVKQTVLPKGYLPKQESLEVVRQLAEIGFEKISFVGGEPTLCPWISDLIKEAKKYDLTTMIVTNGSNLTKEFLEINREYLDWIAISIDSLNENTNISIGRAVNGKKTLSKTYYKGICERIKNYGFGLKINTVVNSKNYNENFCDFINDVRPNRWKVLQALPIKGQNDGKIEDMKISRAQFQSFLNNHKLVSKEIKVVSETNEQMKGSYAMVDPAGRFFDNFNGKHNYSKPINKIGARLAIQQVKYSFEKYIERDGIYNWGNIKASKNITISGNVTSHNSEIGKLLAEKLNFKYISVAYKARKIAEQRGIKFSDFKKYCISNPDFEREIDSQFSKECNRKSNLVINYRLGYKFIPKSFKVFLKVGESVKKNIKNETFKIIKREDSFKNKIYNNYGISDYFDKENYDLIVNVDSKRPSEIVEIIINSFYNK